MLTCSLFLLLLVFCMPTNGNEQCSGSGVFLLFRGQLIPNNSYFLYQDVGAHECCRVYCITNKVDCCGFVEQTYGEWYLPNGVKVLGGFENSNHHKFSRSRGFRRIGLYRHNNPPERGHFSCQLPDYAGINRTLFVNIVNEIPVITSHPISQTAQRGKNVTFTVLLSFGSYSQYHWLKNNIKISQRYDKYHGITTPVLTIFNIQEEDEGEYSCVIDEYLSSDLAELSVGELHIAIPI